jgi:hypothetical protein
MRAVRIRQVTGHKDEVRLHLLEQRANDRDVCRTDRVFSDLTSLIKREIEKPCRRAGKSHGFDTGHGFRFANDALDVLNLRDVDLSRMLSVEPLVRFFRERIYLRPIDAPFRRESLEKIQVATNVVVEHSDVAARHVRDRDVVVVLRHLAQNAAHRDDVVVRMRREADHLAADWQLGLSANLGAEDVEHLSVHFARRAELRDERRHARVRIVALRELEDCLALLLDSQITARTISSCVHVTSSISHGVLMRVSSAPAE